jgi:hypothetical protein
VEGSYQRVAEILFFFLDIQGDFEILKQSAGNSQEFSLSLKNLI